MRIWFILYGVWIGAFLLATAALDTVNRFGRIEPVDIAVTLYLVMVVFFALVTGWILPIAGAIAGAREGAWNWLGAACVAGLCCAGLYTLLLWEVDVGTRFADDRYPMSDLRVLAAVTLFSAGLAGTWSYGLRFTDRLGLTTPV